MNVHSHQLALPLLEEPAMLDTEQLVNQAFILGIGFAFIRPSVSRSKTVLHVLPSTKWCGVQATPEQINLAKATWQAAHDRATEITLYLMDHESCLSRADGGRHSVHHYPTPLRKQRLPRNASASIVEQHAKRTPKNFTL
jgi:hypothetical protein